LLCQIHASYFVPEIHRYVIMSPNLFAVRAGREKDGMPDSDKELGDNTPIVACVTVGAFQENCYLYACPQTHEAVIIDPGDEAESILKSIAELKLVPKYI